MPCGTLINILKKMCYIASGGNGARESEKKILNGRGTIIILRIIIIIVVVVVKKIVLCVCMHSCVAGVS